MAYQSHFTGSEVDKSVALQLGENLVTPGSAVTVSKSQWTETPDIGWAVRAKIIGISWETFGSTPVVIVGDDTAPRKYYKAKATRAAATNEWYVDSTVAVNGIIEFYKLASGGGGGSVAWGSITGTLSNQSDLQGVLNDKAPLANPTFTGTVTVPEPTNDMDAATKAYVDEHGRADIYSVGIQENTQTHGLILDKSFVELNTARAAGKILMLQTSDYPAYDGLIGVYFPQSGSIDARYVFTKFDLPSDNYIVSYQDEDYITATYWILPSNWAYNQQQPHGVVTLENKYNKKTTLTQQSTDDDYPSAKCVYDALTVKAPLESPTFTGTVTVPTPINNDDAATKKYVDDRAGNELIVVKTDTGSSSLTLVNGYEYRYINSIANLSITIPEISAQNALFGATAVYTSNNTTAPTINNQSGHTFIYAGDDVYHAVFVPKANKRYRLAFLFDGIYVTCYIGGVEL